MHHTPAHIPTGITFPEMNKLPVSRWCVEGQTETYCIAINARWAYLDFMDQWRWLALNGTN